MIIQYKRGGLWRLLMLSGIIIWICDVIANYTEWSLVFGPPAKGDITITNRLKTMKESDQFESRREFARLALTMLDACEPDGKH